MDQRRAGISVGGSNDTSNMSSNAEAMTAPTPEQMRALADKMLATADWIRSEVPDVAEELEDGLITLRTAADQLEAVAALHVRDAKPFEPLADITCQECGQFWPCDTYLALTAGTAPQEPETAKRMLMTHPHDGHGPDDTCRDCEASDD